MDELRNILLAFFKDLKVDGHKLTGWKAEELTQQLFAKLTGPYLLAALPVPQEAGRPEAVRVSLDPAPLLEVRGATVEGKHFLEIKIDRLWWRVPAAFAEVDDTIVAIAHLQQAFRVGLGRALTMWGRVLVQEPDARFFYERKST